MNRKHSLFLPPVADNTYTAFHNPHPPPPPSTPFKSSSLADTCMTCIFKPPNPPTPTRLLSSSSAVRARARVCVEARTRRTGSVHNTKRLPRQSGTLLSSCLVRTTPRTQAITDLTTGHTTVRLQCSAVKCDGVWCCIVRCCAV